MAGKTFPDIYCSKMKVGRLTVYLASTRKGAFRVGLELNRSSRPVHFFRCLFPTASLTENDRPNQHLAEAVEAALRNTPSEKALSMDVSFTPFQWAVLKAIGTIPFGHTRTYGAVASMMGRPLAARAVGQVMRRNPFPLFFP
jgi:O6-methylguanine-DNA--protein-cysteine methyltransferase